MSLILAIEPDRRQVAHLVSIVRHVQGAELILADTTEGALESIGNNVPDLILVPALLSPQDDAALAAALRVIASAAHVQMLTIPTFAAPKPAAKRGVLSAFRRKASNDAPIEGCDPKVFAEEIASYIERANEERAAAQYYEDDQDAVQPERSRAKVTTSEDAFVAAFDEPEPQAAFEAVQAETADPEPAYEEPAYQEPAYHAPDYTPVAAVEETPADVWVAPPVADELIIERPAHDRPIFHEVFSTSEPEPEPIFESAPVMDEEARTAAHDAEIADLPAPEMALDEPAATISHSDAEEVEDIAPLAAAAPEPVEPAAEIADIEQAPAFEDMLANFERANLPVIEEVRAEQWMAEPIDGVQDDEVAADTFDDEADDLDIDLSIELDAVVHAEKRANDPEPAQVLKPFEPVVPVERVEPLPLAAWQAWPRLDWTAPETLAKAARNGNGDSHEAADPVAVEFVQVAEFEEALEAEETLERFEPVVPAERVEPMPLAAWYRWPKLEGVAAEAYQEPIAPRKAAAKPEWVELMRSLREDIARRRAELAASEPVAAPPAQKPQRPQAAAARVKAAKPAAPVAPDPATRPKRTRPIEDEWGLFDPEQCGFAALLDKLDEMTVTPPPPQPRRPSSR